MKNESVDCLKNSAHNLQNTCKLDYNCGDISSYLKLGLGKYLTEPKQSSFHKYYMCSIFLWKVNFTEIQPNHTNAANSFMSSEQIFIDML